MKRKLISLFIILFILGFSFFSCNKAVILARNSDPIMKEIIKNKSKYKIDSVSPVIKNDEYKYGINGCKVDEIKSYNNMKQIGYYDDNLIDLKEDKIQIDSNNKYIIGSNNIDKNVSIIFIINKRINNNIINMVKEKNLKINLFVDSYFLENNLEYIEKISKYFTIYNYGFDNYYDDKYITYHNNLIDSITNNKSIYCLTNKNNRNTLNICTKNNMKVIKEDYYKNNILTSTKDNLSNGNILVYKDINNKIAPINVSLNYIIKKGYNIIYLDDLLTSKKDCSKK